MSEKKVAVVMGVGPGLGAALARRFARGGFAVALVSRSEKSLTPVQEEITRAGGHALCVPADATDASSLAQAFGRIRETLGDPSVLVYNAGAFTMGGVLELQAAQIEESWRINCLGALLASREVLPKMLQEGAGTILLTGATASLRGSARFAALAVGKFGLRALAQSMARELGPQGVHVAHVVVDGQIDSPRIRAMMPGRAVETFLAPDAIAETYWQLHSQERTAWTHELDVRPAMEKF